MGRTRSPTVGTSWPGPTNTVCRIVAKPGSDERPAADNTYEYLAIISRPRLCDVALSHAVLDDIAGPPDVPSIQKVVLKKPGATTYDLDHPEPTNHQSLVIQRARSAAVSLPSKGETHR
jgi:hypothetical protein